MSSMCYVSLQMSFDSHFLSIIPCWIEEYFCACFAFRDRCPIEWGARSHRYLYLMYIPRVRRDLDLYGVVTSIYNNLFLSDKKNTPRFLPDACIRKRGSCAAGIDLYLPVGRVRFLLRLKDERYFLSFSCSIPSITYIEMVSLLFFFVFPTLLAITE